MSLFHFSDPHFSFVPFDKDTVTNDRPTYGMYMVQKPMDKRSWSVGSSNYVGYIDTLVETLKTNVKPNDIVVITGDLTHDMPKSKVIYTLMFIDSLPGIKVIIRGNHDFDWNFGAIRANAYGWVPKSTFMIEEGGIQAVGPYMFGCWSNHKGAKRKEPEVAEVKGEQKAFCNDHFMLNIFAQGLKDVADMHKKTPILLSHYPVPLSVGEYMGRCGIKAYLSGHVHCTNGKTSPTADWTWYNKTAVETDGKILNGCLFSTGTTDVLLNRHGKIIKEINLDTPKPHPKARDRLPKLKGKPAPFLIVLCGIPGSGKTTASEKLIKTYDAVRISQDDLGSRQDCLRECASALARGQSVVVDRTNVNLQQRHYWISLARHYHVKHLMAIYWELGLETCIERAIARKGHPTMTELIPDDRKAEIIKQFSNNYTKPEVNEGFHEVVKYTEPS